MTTAGRPRCLSSAAEATALRGAARQKKLPGPLGTRRNAAGGAVAGARPVASVRRRRQHGVRPLARSAGSESAPNDPAQCTQSRLDASVSSWSERQQRLKAQILEAGSAGACTLVICNAAYFTLATLFVWFQILHVPRGIALATSGMHMGQAMGIAYASCQATKLPRILGTLMLVPFIHKLLDWVTGGHGTACKSIFIAVLVSCLSLTFGSFGAVAFLWTM